MAKYLPANDRFRFFDTFWTFLVVFGNNIMMEVRLFVFMLVRNLFLEMLSCMNLTSRKNLVMKTRTFIFVMHLMHFDISLEEDFCLYLKGCVHTGGGGVGQNMHLTVCLVRKFNWLCQWNRNLTSPLISLSYFQFSIQCLFVKWIKERMNVHCINIFHHVPISFSNLKINDYLLAKSSSSAWWNNHHARIMSKVFLI